MIIKTCARQRSGKLRISLPGRGYVVLTLEEMLHG